MPQVGRLSRRASSDVRYLIPLIALALGAVLIAARPDAQPPACYTRSQGQRLCVDERFLAFWRRQGGPEILGLPVTAAFNQAGAGGTRLVQYFDRARLELHPELAPPYDIMLGRVGAERLALEPRTRRADAAELSAGDCRTFTTTSYRVCGRLLQFWRSHGLRLDDNPAVSEPESLALFGLPLTGAWTESSPSGGKIIVQWFERALLVERADGSVLMSPLGRELAASQATPAQPVTTTPAQPTLVPTATPTLVPTEPPPTATLEPTQPVTTTSVAPTETPTPSVAPAETPTATATPAPPTPAAAPPPAGPPVINVPQPGVPCSRNVPAPANGLQLWVTDPNDADGTDQMTACLRLIVNGEAANGANAVIYRHYGGETRDTIPQSTGLDGVASFIFYTGPGSPGRPDNLQAIVSYQGVTYGVTLWLR